MEVHVACGAGLACACGQSSLMVAYFPSRYCGDNHTVFGSYLCAYVRQLVQTLVYDSMYVHLETQGQAGANAQG